MSRMSLKKTTKELNAQPMAVINKYDIPDFLRQGRENPINGAECFFTEATYRKVIGPEPSFHDRFMIQLARAKEGNTGKTKEQKKRHKDLDLPSEKRVGLRGDKTISPKPSQIHPVFQGLGHLNGSHINDNDSCSSDDDDDNDGAVNNLVILEDVSATEPDPNEDTVSEAQSKSYLELKAETKNAVHASDLQILETSAKTTENAEECKNQEDKPCDYVVKNKINDSLTMSPTSSCDQQSKLCNEKATLVPLYAVGIPNYSSKFSQEASAEEVDKQDIPTSSETGPPEQQENRQTEEIECLVMPRAFSDSEDDVDDHEQDQTESLPYSGSGLPLIPALMSEKRRSARKEKPLPQSAENVLEAPTTTHFFYSNNEISTSDPQSKHDSLNTGSLHGSSSVEKIEDIPIFPMVEDTPDTGQDITVKKKLRNKSVWSMDPSDTQDKKPKTPVTTDKSIKEAMKFRKSALTREEMASYLYLFGKYVRPYLHGGCLPLLTEQQKREMAELETLKQKVQLEQREFQSYLHQNAIKNPKFYSLIKPNAKHYANTKVQVYRWDKKVKQKFLKDPSAKISFKQTSSRVNLAFQKVLLEVGAAPKIVLPDLKSGTEPVPIPEDMQKIEKNFPRYPKPKIPGFISHERVCEDINSQTLAIKYSADVVLSSSVLKCLLNNVAPGYPQAWNIPVLVREHQLEGGKQKVVYLNKPLFEQNLYLRDLNALYHKYALRVMISTPKQTLAQTSLLQARNLRAANSRANAKTVDDPFDVFSTDYDNLETFGQSSVQTSHILTGTAVSAPSKAGQEERNVTEQKIKPTGLDSVQDQNTSSDTETSSLTNKIAEHSELRGKSLRKRTLPLLKDSKSSIQDPSPPKIAKESMFKIGKKVVSLTTPEPSDKKKQLIQPQFSFSRSAQGGGDNPLDLILGPDAADGEDKKGVSPQEDPTDFLPPTEELCSLVYSLWHLGQIKMLSRTRSQGTCKLRNVYLATKMEYQPNHGYEQVTPDEMIKNWSACYLRPDTKLLRARINAFTSEIMTFEELETDQILQPSCNFRPDDGFSFLNALLKQLLRLECGNYLLSHEPGADHCGLKPQKAESRFDNIVQTVPTPVNQTSPAQVPWIPIDPFLMLPYHMMHQRIPATFMPKDVVMSDTGKKKLPSKINPAVFSKRMKKSKKKRLKNTAERDFF